MNARTTDVCWDPTLVRVEYLDEAGNPYYCCFNARDQAPVSRTCQEHGDQTIPCQPEQVETPAGGLVVLVITVVVKNGSEGNGQDAPAEAGPDGSKRTGTRGYRSESVPLPARDGDSEVSVRHAQAPGSERQRR